MQDSDPRPWMVLPKHPGFPEYYGFHLMDDWCVKVGCRKVCDVEKIIELGKLKAGREVNRGE